MVTLATACGCWTCSSPNLEHLWIPSSLQKHSMLWILHPLAPGNRLRSSSHTWRWVMWWIFRLWQMYASCWERKLLLDIFWSVIQSLFLNKQTTRNKVGPHIVIYRIAQLSAIWWLKMIWKGIILLAICWLVIESDLKRCHIISKMFSYMRGLVASTYHILNASDRQCEQCPAHRRNSCIIPLCPQVHFSA